MLPMFLAVVDQTIVATALPAIAASTGQIERASWIVVSYLIAATIAAPLYGRLGDSFGRRRIMFAALAVFIFASLLCAASPTVELLTLARVFQGLGGGGLMTLSQALVGEAFPPRERARYQGYLAAVALTWRLPTLTKERLPWRADPGGLVLFTIFVATILLSLEQMQRVKLSVLPASGGLLIVSVIALVLLVRHENRVTSPLIPLGLLRQPAIWHSDALAACHGAALVSLITFLPIYLQVVRGSSPSATGLLMVPLTVGIGAGSLLTGRLVNKTGLTTVFPVVGLAMATVNLVVLALWASALGTAVFAVLLLCNGLFMGTVMGVVQVSVQSAAGLLRLGEAAASVQFSRSIGAAFGTALVATVLFSALSIRSPEAARVFATMVEQGKPLASSLTPAQQIAIQADISAAFRAAFLAMAAFTTTGFFLALTNPLRRI